MPMSPLLAAGMNVLLLKLKSLPKGSSVMHSIELPLLLEGSMIIEDGDMEVKLTIWGSEPNPNKVGSFTAHVRIERLS